MMLPVLGTSVRISKNKRKRGRRDVAGGSGGRQPGFKSWFLHLIAISASLSHLSVPHFPHEENGGSNSVSS